MHHLSRMLPLAALLSLPLCAQASWGLGAKFGVGTTLGTLGQQGTRGSVLCGIQGECRLEGVGIFYGELVYRTFRSYQFEATRFGAATAPDGKTGEITKWAFDATAGLNRADGRYDSADIRKNLLEGLALQMGYRYPLGDGTWSLQGGLSLSALRSTQEVVGSLKIVQNRTAATPTVLFTENMLLTRSKTSLRPGCFAGVRGDLGRNFFVEGSLSAVGYTEVNHLPASYSGASASIETRNRLKAVLDLSAGFRF